MVTLEELSELSRQLRIKKQELESLEKQVKDRKAEVIRLESVLIPDALRELGLSEVKLANGASISYKTEYFANISEERSKLALTWLKDNGFEALVKTVVAMKFGAGMAEKVDHLMLTNFLKEHDYDFQEKGAVHPQTLKAFVKERIEFENEVSNNVPPDKKLPRELFGVFTQFKTVVEEPKP